MAKSDAKTKAAKKMLEAEESSPSKVSMGQMRAAEEEQRMGRRGMDTGKKQKKIPSDPIEHIRTLYGTGKPNDKVKKARKRLYDRYVKQGKLEPILPVYRDHLADGKKIPEYHKKDRLAGADAYQPGLERGGKQLAKVKRERDEYAKTGKSHFDELESVRRAKQSDPHKAGLLDERVDRTRADMQKSHKKHQEARLEGGKYWDTVEAGDDDYLAEIFEWRRKHGKKGKK